MWNLHNPNSSTVINEWIVFLVVNLFVIFRSTWIEPTRAIIVFYNTPLNSHRRFDKYGDQYVLCGWVNTGTKFYQNRWRRFWLNCRGKKILELFKTTSVLGTSHHFGRWWRLTGTHDSGILVLRSGSITISWGLNSVLDRRECGLNLKQKRTD